MSFSPFTNGGSSQSVSIAIGNQLSGQFVPPKVATPTTENSLSLREKKGSLKKQNSRKLVHCCHGNICHCFVDTYWRSFKLKYRVNYLQDISIAVRLSLINQIN